MDGRFLYNRRISLNLSQIEVAQSLGYSSQMVSLWESNKNTPSLNVLGKYASILNIDLEGLILAINKKENTFCDELFFDSVAFGQNIRRLRRLKGITQKDLAKIISCPANALMRFEKGISYPSIEQFVALCNYFKVKFDELYFCIKLSPSKDTKAKKKKVILPILIPIIIAVSVGGTTMGVTLSNNRKKASNADINNNSEPLTDLTFYNSGINDDSVTSMDIDLTNKSPLGQALFGTYPQDPLSHPRNSDRSGTLLCPRQFLQDIFSYGQNCCSRSRVTKAAHRRN